MGRIHRPTKEQVRAWLAERRQTGQCLPDCEQIRQQLGWNYYATGMQLHAATEQQEGAK